MISAEAASEPIMSAIGKRLLLSTGALVLGLVAVEVLYRVLKPAPYHEPRLIKSDGQILPLSEMAAMYRLSGQAENGEPADGPRSRIQAGLRWRHCYDRPVWDYFDADGCVTIATNKLGFRDLEFSVDKKPGELRILAVGDSFTFGSGVQLEDSWPQVLEELLRRGREQPVEVINGGFAAGSHYVPGYVEWLAEDGLAFEPDIVIVGLCLNDLHPTIQMLGYPVVEPDLEPWLGGVSELLSYFQREWRQRELRQQEFDLAELLKFDLKPWEQNKQAMRGLRDLFAEHEIRFIVAVLPMVSNLGEHCPYAGLHDLVTAFCAEEKIECIDLLPTVRHRDELDLWVHPTDQHPNAVANRLFADRIREYLAP